MEEIPTTGRKEVIAVSARAFSSRRAGREGADVVNWGIGAPG